MVASGKGACLVDVSSLRIEGLAPLFLMKPLQVDRCAMGESLRAPLALVVSSLRKGTRFGAYGFRGVFAKQGVLNVKPAVGQVGLVSFTISARRGRSKDDMLWRVQVVQKTPLLWRVEGKRPSYLLGTIHTGVALGLLPPVVLGALSKARILLLEVDPRRADLSKAASLMLLPGKQRLDRLLKKRAWKRLTEELYPTRPAALLRLQPWAASQLLIYRWVARRGKGKADGIEQGLLISAERKGIPVGQLEDWSVSMELMNRISPKRWAREVAQMVRDPNQTMTRFDALTAAYLRADLKALHRIVFEKEQVKKFPEFYLSLLKGRNLKWLPELRRQLDTGGAFIAVGAAHYLGPDGLIELLRAEGYEVSPVSAELGPIPKLETWSDVAGASSGGQDQLPGGKGWLLVALVLAVVGLVCGGVILARRRAGA